MSYNKVVKLASYFQNKYASKRPSIEEIAEVIERNKENWWRVSNDFISLALGKRNIQDIKDQYYPGWEKQDFIDVIEGCSGEPFDEEEFSYLVDNDEDYEDEEGYRGTYERKFASRRPSIEEIAEKVNLFKEDYEMAMEFIALALGQKRRNMENIYPGWTKRDFIDVVETATGAPFDEERMVDVIERHIHTSDFTNSDSDLERTSFVRNFLREEE